jgi:hypothetical protein
MRVSWLSILNYFSNELSIFFSKAQLHNVPDEIVPIKEISVQLASQ